MQQNRRRAEKKRRRKKEARSTVFLLFFYSPSIVEDTQSECTGLFFFIQFIVPLKVHSLHKKKKEREKKNI
jgi:hypothetical protein